MSELPTLGRAVRTIAPVAIAALLAAPAAASAAVDGADGDSSGGNDVVQGRGGDGRGAGPGEGDGAGYDVGLGDESGDASSTYEESVEGDQPATQHERSETAAGTAAAAPPERTRFSTPSRRRARVSRRVIVLRLGGRVRSAKVLVDGRPAKVTVRNGRAFATVDLRGRAAGAYVVRTIVMTPSGRVTRERRVFRTCVPGSTSRTVTS